MQQLKFEASWEKAVSEQDRQMIEGIFNEIKHLKQSVIICSPIREAINHKEDLLVSVLVNNFTNHPCTFNNVTLVYKMNGEVIAENVFTLPKLMIPDKISMPWTFIFPKGTYIQHSSFRNGRIEII